MGLVPAGSHANRRFCEKHLEIDPQVNVVEVDLLSDAQTSGGLLIALSPQGLEAFKRHMGEDDGWTHIGEFTHNAGPVIRVKP